MFKLGVLQKQKGVTGGNVLDINNAATYLRNTSPGHINLVQHILKPESECAFDSMNSDICTPVDEIKSIYYSTIKNGKSKNVKDMLQELKEANECDSELCVINKVYHKQSEKAIELFKNFKPEGPKNTTEWLSNFNIDEVLTQIKNSELGKKRKYKHIGFQMIDFAKYRTELSKFDIIKCLDEGYRTFGCVINTDTYDGMGKHWFAIFIEYYPDTKTISFEYFNSGSNKIIREISDAFRDMQRKIISNASYPKYFSSELQIEIHENKYVFQRDTHSCGVYSIAYILLRLCGIDVNMFKYPAIMNDSFMVYLRKNLFTEVN